MSHMSSLETFVGFCSTRICWPHWYGDNRHYCICSPGTTVPFPSWRLMPSCIYSLLIWFSTAWSIGGICQDFAEIMLSSISGGMKECCSHGIVGVQIVWFLSAYPMVCLQGFCSYNWWLMKPVESLASSGFQSGFACFWSGSQSSSGESTTSSGGWITSQVSMEK
jgi:hypothetical protein